MSMQLQKPKKVKCTEGQRCNWESYFLKNDDVETFDLCPNHKRYVTEVRKYSENMKST